MLRGGKSGRSALNVVAERKNSSGRFFWGHQTSCYVTVIKTVSGVDSDLATEGLKRIDKVV